MAPTYVALHGSYNLLQLAFCKGESCLSIIKKDDVRASSHLVNYLDELLIEQKTSLAEVDFFIVDYGPGAFTSLRVIIAAVNGLGFAIGTKLIPVSGLEGLIADAALANKDTIKISVALLNAYNSEVYFLVSAPNYLFKNKMLEGYGYCSAELFLNALQEEFGELEQILFLGNGTVLFADMIKKIFANAVINTSILVPSVESIARIGFKKWESGDLGVTRIVPLYLKTQLFAIKK